MTTTMPRVEVQAPALVPYPFGVLSVVSFAMPADGHQFSGVWWTSKGVGAVGTTYSPCDVDAPDPIDALDPNVACTVKTSSAVFTLYAYNDDSVGGGDLEEKYARAADLLVAGEQFGIEAALWAAFGDASAVDAGTGADVVEAVARLEQNATEAFGGTPVLHMSRYNATMGHDVVSPAGTRLRSLLGSDVVAGGGYTDDDVVYATGPLVITRGPIMNLGQHIDRATDQISAVVERTYSIGWDGALRSATIS